MSFWNRLSIAVLSIPLATLGLGAIPTAHAEQVAGSTSLRSGSSDCTVKGGPKRDRIIVRREDVVVCSGDGNDKIIIKKRAGYADVRGGDGDDEIIVKSNEGAYIEGGGGNDHIVGSGGNDSLFGGPGDDVIEGGEGADRMFGDGAAHEGRTHGTGDDVILGGGGGDYVRGGAGADYINTGSAPGSFSGFEFAYGGEGNDFIFSTEVAWSDVFDGEEGNDVVIPTPYRVDPLGNVAQGGDGFDLIVTLNGLIDAYDPAGGLSIPVPIPNSPCQVTVAPGENSSYSASCTLPLTKSFKGVTPTFSLSASRDEQGKKTITGTLGAGLTGLPVKTALKISNKGMNLPNDVCIVDPKVSAYFPGDVTG